MTSHLTLTLCSLEMIFYDHAKMTFANTFDPDEAPQNFRIPSVYIRQTLDENIQTMNVQNLFQRKQHTRKITSVYNDSTMPIRAFTRVHIVVTVF